MTARILAAWSGRAPELIVCSAPSGRKRASLPAEIRHRTSNLEYDFARRVPTSAVLEGLTCAGERKYFGDDRLELSFIHDRGDLIQLPAISVDNEKYSTGAVLLSDTGRNRRN